MNNSNLLKSIGIVASSIKGEVNGSQPIQYQQVPEFKPVFYVQNITDNIERIGNIFISKSMMDTILSVESGNDVYNKINKISESLWNFETTHDLKHNLYALTAYTNINKMQIQSVDITANNISITGNTIASVVDDSMDISSIRN